MVAFPQAAHSGREYRPGAAGIALLALFGALEARLAVIGWISQLLAFALFQLFVAARIALRLGLLASQGELQAGRGR